MKLAKLLFILMASYLCTIGQAQELGDSAAFKIPPMHVFVNAALSNAPELNAIHYKQQEVSQDLKIAKKAWADYIFIEGTTNYGLYDQVLISSQQSDGDAASGLISKNEQVRYYSGVGIKLPVSAILSRPNAVKKEKYRMAQLDEVYAQTEQSITQQIIKLYFRLLQLNESMKTSQSIYQTLEMALLKSEREFVNGRMDLQQYATLASTTGKAKNEYDKLKAEFLTEYYILKQLTGLTIDNRD